MFKQINSFINNTTTVDCEKITIMLSGAFNYIIQHVCYFSVIIILIRDNYSR